MIKIAYLTDKFKNIYRIKAPYDTIRIQFPRKFDGTFEDNDLFIDCQNNVRIFYYGKGYLQAYIPSIGRGNNILKAIEIDKKNNLIFNIERTDSEILFKFHSKNMKDLESYLKPRTFGAGISPYSTKNLPKDKSYKIPDEDLNEYKKLMSNIPQNQMVIIGQSIKSFLQSLVTKKNTWEDIKADMAVKGLRGKEYIHSIGKWEQYLSYLKEVISE